MKNPRARVNKHSGSDKVPAFRKALLSWYDENSRDLPWRYDPGEAADPYAVWLSEIMLQQTTVAAVIPYFLKFTALWPNIFALAAADINDVMKEWAGLGYYARARNLHKCAQVVAYERGGVFPEDQKELMTLPGIGEYTSAAIRTIAFGKSATVVDGNVERVMARVHGLKGDPKTLKKESKIHAGAYFEGFEQRPGDLAQAFMDLGATVCTPKTPRCAECPIKAYCSSGYLYSKGMPPQDMTNRAFTKEKREGVAFWVHDETGRVLLQRRAPRGILGGVVGFPTCGWEHEPAESQFLSCLESAEHLAISAPVKHSFTHFDLVLKLRVTSLCGKVTIPESFFWCSAQKLGSVGFPSLFSKAYRIFLTDSLSRD